MTTDPSVNYAPFWSPQGDRIAFGSSREGGIFNLYYKGAGGTGQDELLLSNGNNKAVSQWSRDGRFIVYGEAGSKTKTGYLGAAHGRRSAAKAWAGGAFPALGI